MTLEAVKTKSVSVSKAPPIRTATQSAPNGYKDEISSGDGFFDLYQECGIQGLTDRSRRPYRYANQLPFRVENYTGH